jgi:hypothetical protein
LARLESTLAVEEDGCIYAGGPTDGTALVFPVDYDARVGVTDLVELIDGTGRLILQEGDRFAAGGGLGPEGDQRAEVVHARVAHGRSVFFIQHAIERLDS